MRFGHKTAGLLVAVHQQQKGLPLLQACVRIAESMTGGSDLHVQLAVRAAKLAGAVHGSGSAAAVAAAAAARRAHALRYGPLGPQLEAALMTANLAHVDPGM
jgi:C4-dicarboxylate transporter